MSPTNRPYLPGSESGAPQAMPLGRFLPPYQPGTALRWLGENLSPGQWLLDPLGANPLPALEAARAGYRVLVTSNNPILAFLLEVLASAPQPDVFQSVLAELGAARRGDERLEVHLQSLYETTCPGCGEIIPAQAFLWRRGETQPFARLVRCPRCAAEGEYPLAPEDLSALTRLGSDNLHRSRALERVIPADDAARPAVEEALKSYLPRPLYVLFTLLNKTEGLGASPERKRLLTALLLSLCDEASSLWPWPSARSRPRQLTIPPTFRENNLWLALDSLVQQWLRPGAPVPLVVWPELPPEDGGICLYPGRLRSLMPLPEHIRPAAALGMIPRPNQAFWLLSALWTGWLWGREAVQPLKGTLERRRYDWHWHAGALHSVFAALNSTTPAGFPYFAILAEAAPGYLAAAICAGQAAGFTLDGLALRSDEQSAQFTWRSARGKPLRPSISLEAVVRQGIHDFLTQHGQPAGYLALMGAALANCARRNALPAQQAQIDERALDGLQTAFSIAIQDSAFLTRYQGTPGTPESGQWYLTEPTNPARPLLERIETEALRRLEAVPGAISLPDLDAALCAAFPGLETPPLDWTRVILESYAAPDSTQTGMWALRPDSDTAQRAAAQQGALIQLGELAGRLGFSALGDQPLIWKGERGKVLYSFFVNELAASGPAILAQTSLDGQPVLVYADGRAGLLLEALERDARINEEVFAAWRFLKFESLRAFCERPALTLDDWQELLAGAVLHRREASQLQMF